MMEKKLTDRPRVQHPDLIDLSPVAGRVPLKLRLALSQIMGNVPGVCFEHAAVPLPMNDDPEIEITYTGWSPTLHRLRHVIKVEVGVRPDSRQYAEAVADAISPIMEEQVQRHREGMRFGLSAPLPIGIKGTSPETRHLTMDTSLAIVAAFAEDDLLEDLPDALERMHRTDARELGPAIMDGNAYGIESGLGHIVGKSMSWDISREVHVSCDGLAIEIYGRTAPETMLLQMPGRPLSELIQLHPELDRRIVQTAESGESRNSMRIRFVPEVVPYVDIPEIMRAAKR